MERRGRRRRLERIERKSAAGHTEKEKETKKKNRLEALVGQRMQGDENKNTERSTKNNEEKKNQNNF